MKQILGAFILSLLCLSARAQMPDFSNLPPMLFYFGANGQYMQIAEEDAYVFNFRGAVSWNANNAIGFTFSSTVNKFAPSFEPDSSVFLKTTLTGLFYEYSWKPTKNVHLTFPINAGVGEAYMDWRDLSGGGTSFPYEEKYFFYAEPSVMVEYNISKKVRAHVGASYVLVPGKVDYRGLQSSDFNGLTGVVGIKFGKFFGEKAKETKYKKTGTPDF